MTAWILKVFHSAMIAMSESDWQAHKCVKYFSTTLTPQDFFSVCISKTFTLVEMSHETVLEDLKNVNKGIK